MDFTNFVGVILLLAFLVAVSMIVTTKFNEYKNLYKENRVDFWVATTVCLFFVLGVATVLTNN